MRDVKCIRHFPRAKNCLGLLTLHEGLGVAMQLDNRRGFSTTNYSTNGNLSAVYVKSSETKLGPVIIH
jgi:hypothetical protein